MLRQKSTVNFVSYLALLVVFLCSANLSIAQTPDETTATKTSVESPESLGVPEPAKTTTTITPVAGPPPMQAQCKRNLKANVVAIAQPIFLNRLGAVIPGGMVFALKSDTVGGLGKQLRADKRPRPIVLRANFGFTLDVPRAEAFQNSYFRDFTMKVIGKIGGRMAKLGEIKVERKIVAKESASPLKD